MVHPRRVEPRIDETQAPAVVAVVGAGASGTLVAIHLLESPAVRAGKIRILLIEKKTAIGRGVAYGSEAPFHLLNVRQNRMSAYADNADHFARWIARAYPADMKNGFQPRARYGEYLASTLNDAKRGSPANSLAILTGEVKAFRAPPGEKPEITLVDGKKINVDRIVITTGYRAPEVPHGLVGVRENEFFMSDPWAPVRGRPIGPNENILVIGSGLTTVDFAMSRMRAGHLAPIDVVSRHGLSPLAHPAKPSEFPLATPFPNESARGVFRALRDAADRAGEAWPDVVDRFRAEIPRIWSKWPDSEKRRFLRHARPYWEVHRHRISPEVHREWDLYRRAGKVKIEAGRIRIAEASRDGILVQITKRGGGMLEKRFDRIVNCTGAVPDLSLFSGHDYLDDSLELGVPTDEVGRPLGRDGVFAPAVFLLGPALRTRFWEMTAVPDLRLQAKKIGDAIASGLGH